MPLYEYRCTTCRQIFELLRPMAGSGEPVMCPQGHQNAERVVSLVAARSWGGGDIGELEMSEGGGGCGGCSGGACACGH